jgi:predicted transposase/invertase (TIGR01784 family)
MPGEKDAGYFHHVQLKNQNNQVFYDKLSYIYIELPKFTKNIDELENHLEKWLYFLKHLEEFDKLPEIFREEVFVQTLNRIDYLSLTQEEQHLYERSLKHYRDQINAIETAIEEGREEGREEGEKNKAIASARIMKNDGVPMETIAKYTGLSIDEIEKL